MGYGQPLSKLGTDEFWVGIKKLRKVIVTSEWIFVQLVYGNSEFKVT